ncbi:MAG: hypothetical protein J6U01_10850 [Clostridia bacterium]|nr:hypothetical protein [Clostridia bacterium]
MITQAESIIKRITVKESEKQTGGDAEKKESSELNELSMDQMESVSGGNESGRKWHVELMS